MLLTVGWGDRALHEPGALRWAFPPITEYIEGIDDSDGRS